MWARVEQVMARQIRRLRPIPRADADAVTQRIAAQIERDFGAFVPPFALHAEVPALLAACWTMLRESLVAVHADRRAKEAVAAAVSRLNACTYCVDAHTAALHALGDASAADAIAAGGNVGDPTLAPYVAWAAATLSPDDPALRRPPFARAAAPELIGIAACFHYINRMVAIFLVPSPLPFTSPRLKAVARRMIAPIVGGFVARALAPGESLTFLPAAAPPPDLAWTEGTPAIADAFARAAAAFETAGAAVVPPSVRTALQDRLRAWRGEAMGLGRGWLEEAVATVDTDERAIARLVLLTAFAPFQVDDATIADFTRVRPGDAALLAATAWASFATARRIAAWLTADEAPRTGQRSGDLAAER